MPSSSSLALLLLTLTIAATAVAKEFQVGDDVGWRIPASNETELYNVWASRRRFHIGDSLRFQYKNDSVVVVLKSAFHHCDSSQAISSFNDGNTVINLEKPGRFYFISGKSDRCNKGEKMIVNVIRPHHFTPSIATPPNSPYFTMSPVPAPSQLPGFGTSSGSRPSVSVSFTVGTILAAIAVFSMCFVQP